LQFAIGLLKLPSFVQLPQRLQFRKQARAHVASARFGILQQKLPQRLVASKQLERVLLQFDLRMQIQDSAGASGSGQTVSSPRPSRLSKTFSTGGCQGAGIRSSLTTCSTVCAGADGSPEEWPYPSRKAQWRVMQ